MTSTPPSYQPGRSNHNRNLNELYGAQESASEQPPDVLTRSLASFISSHLKLGPSKTERSAG
ncbi:hypothetical protein TMatcc_010295 [Talaromyces marneffei ATCC 18224]